MTRSKWFSLLVCCGLGLSLPAVAAVKEPMYMQVLLGELKLDDNTVTATRDGTEYEGELDTETKVRIVSAVVCAAVTERDPAEAIKYLINCGVDAPTDFVDSIIGTFDYLDEYQLLHPPNIAHRSETENGTEYEIIERN